MTPRVRLADLGAQHRSLSPEIRRAIDRVIESSEFVLGRFVEAFEAEVAAFLGTRHAVGVSSGTDALLVALQSLGVGPGDEVITTPFSFFATVECILRLGATPRFVDVDPKTLLIDSPRIEDALGPRTRAILPVHLYGSVVPMEGLVDLARRRGIPIVEDAAQAFGSMHGSRAAGTWGTLGCFSFFPAKVLGALGDGGLIVTNDPALAERCRRIRQHGCELRGQHAELGGNFRLDAIQAAVLSAKLPCVESWIARRRQHAAAFDAAFSGSAAVSPVGRTHGWNGSAYVVRVCDGRRGPFRAHLAERGIESAMYYERPLHLQPALAALGLEPGELPESELASGEVVALPVHSEMTEAARQVVVDAVASFG